MACVRGWRHLVEHIGTRAPRQDWHNNAPLVAAGMFAHHNFSSELALAAFSTDEHCAEQQNAAVAASAQASASGVKRIIAA